MSMEKIERLTEKLSNARDVLRQRLDNLKSDQDAIKRRRIKGLKNSVDRVATIVDRLENAIKDGRDLFKRPKTRVLHGFKVGYRKQKGKTVISDEGETIRLIKKHFPDQTDVLIKSTEKPVKEAINDLDAKDLKRIGVRIEADSDVPYIKASDTEVDKLIDSLLSEHDLEGIDQ